MNVTIRVVPGSSQQKVVEMDGILKVYVHARAQGGEANDAVRNLLADYYAVPKSQIVIVRGQSARNKVIEITRRNHA